MLLHDYNPPDTLYPVTPRFTASAGLGWGGFDGSAHYVDPVLGMRGLGAAGTIGSTVAQTTGQGLLTAAPFTGPAAPFVALAGAITLMVSKLFGGCGQACVLASNDANAIEQKLQQNLTLYLSQPTRTASMQAAALQNFDAIWNALVQACGQIGGGAGGNCISDRKQGACKWQASAGGWGSDGAYHPAGAAGSGSTCWNWFVGYRDPIANDPHVAPDAPLTQQAGGALDAATGAASGTGAGLLNGTVLGIPIWLLLGGAVLWSVLK